MSYMQPFPHDLFGQVPVTVQDVRAWLAAVPRIDPDGPRAAHYVRAYGVVDKIARAKLDGTFEAVTAPRPRPAGAWWDRFHWP